jgi:hypothetical protein
MKRAVWLLALTACNRAFDIGETAPEPDAPPPADSDGDGVNDLDDNCPMVENDQSDADADLIGDRCDNCPLVGNPEQELAGDTDLVGTACDPHPETDGDCLVLLDSFTDPATFATAWAIYGAVPPAIETRPGSVTVTPAKPNELVALAARDNGGVLLAGTFDTQLAGVVAMTEGGSVYAASNIPESTTYGNGCGLFWSMGGQLACAARNSSIQDGTTIVTPALFGAHVTDETVLRLTSPTTAAPTVRCRAEYGTAVGATMTPLVTLRPEGAPGVVIGKDAVTLEAVAFYRVQSATCTTTYR